MYIKQLYTPCLSEAAYYIESEHEAAIIDPLRDIDEYLHLAKERNATIKYIFETHFHADFVSGHIDLSKATGAPIIYGPNASPGFEAHIAKDEEVFTIGNIKLQVLHTPGHTLESSCYLLKDEKGNDHALFTGDTLFVGDVGRPDLAQNGDDLTTEHLAGMLYDSIQHKILPLNDKIIIYPAHGPGSACGKSIGQSTVSTMGEEKENNYALQQNTREEFIKVVIDGLPEPPEYFHANAQINKHGYESFDSLLQKTLKPLTVSQFEQLMQKDDVIVLDSRNAHHFSEGFIPGSICIGLEGRFAEWAGSILPSGKQLLLVTEKGKEEETITRLARVGIENIAGYLEEGLEAWKKSRKPVDMLINIEADELAMDIPFDDHLVLVDVRKESEFENGHVKEAVNIPLTNLTDPASMSPFNDDDNIYIYCGSGYRSVIAASLLKRQGIHNLRNVLGGWKAIAEIDKIKTEKGALK